MPWCLKGKSLQVWFSVYFACFIVASVSPKTSKIWMSVFLWTSKLTMTLFMEFLISRIWKGLRILKITLTFNAISAPRRGRFYYYFFFVLQLILHYSSSILKLSSCDIVGRWHFQLVIFEISMKLYYWSAGPVSNPSYLYTLSEPI